MTTNKQMHSLEVPVVKPDQVAKQVIGGVPLLKVIAPTCDHIVVCFGGTGETNTKILKSIQSKYENLIQPSSVILNGGTHMGHNIVLDRVAKKTKNTLSIGCTTSENLTQNIPFPPNNDMNFIFSGENASWGFETFFFFAIVHGLADKKRDIIYSFCNGGQITLKEFLFTFLMQPCLQNINHINQKIVIHNGTGRAADFIIERLKNKEQFSIGLDKSFFVFTPMRINESKYKITANFARKPTLQHKQLDAVYAQDYIVMKSFRKMKSVALDIEIA